MSPQNVIQTLRDRGLLNDVTDPDVEKILMEKPASVYVGFDPTADSLHIGNLVGVLVLRHFQLAGHKPIALVGGATGMIGDPSGKSAERNLLSQEQIEKNLEGIRRDLSQYLDFSGDNAAVILNNADWLVPFGFIEFLRDVGKHFRVGEMLARDSVKSRLESQSGMSFTEFSYSMLQAYDFRYLYEKHDCVLQSGGSDQWGNIVAGTDLIRRTLGGRAFGVVTPLLTDAEGKKMGKSAGGAIFLNPEKFSPYEFYQFWVRQEDAVVEKFLKMMTFLPLNEIAEIMKQHEPDPSQRIAQKKLAWEITAMTHGEEEAKRAVDASEALFGGELKGASDEKLRSLYKDVPSVELPRTSLEEGIALVDLLVQANVVGSKKEAKRLVGQNGVYLNNSDTPWPGDQRVLTAENLASESMLIVRTGKKNYRLVQFV